MSPDTTALESLLQYCQDNCRVCPQPQRWQELYGLLPETKRAGAGWEPALPLILAAWWDTPHLAKIMRLREHQGVNTRQSLGRGRSMSGRDFCIC